MLSKAERINEHYNFINSKELLIRTCLINGRDLDVSKVRPKLVLVEKNTCWETIFRWWNLTWWSLPYERSYGRQMRYVIWDEYHEAPIGLLGLQSPILSWSVRDQYLGITKERRDYWVNQSLSAQRLGALPPYNRIIGGKLIALLASSNIVIDDYKTKYDGLKTLMRKREIPARLLFLTTTGAYGKSSIYNRLKYQDEDIAKFIGYSNGSGSFHIPNTFFQRLLVFLESKGVDIRRGYGSGPSRKMRLIDMALQYLGFKDGISHGVKRAVYLFPLVRNLIRVVSGDVPPSWYHRSVEELTDYWKTRWALRRINRDKSYLSFNGESFLNEELYQIRKNNDDFKEFKLWINSR